MRYLITAAAAVLFLGAVFAVLRILGKNTTVYRATGNGNEFEKCGRYSLSIRDPVIRADRLRVPAGGVIAFEINAKTARSLRGKTIRVCFQGRNYEHPVGEIGGSYWFKTDVGPVAPKEKKARLPRSGAGLSSLFRSRLFLGSLCLSAAALIAFVLLPRLYRERAAVTQIVVLRRDIGYGTTVTEDMLTVTEVGSAGLCGQVIRTQSEVIGRVAKAPVYAGESLRAERFMTEEEYRSEEPLLGYDLSGEMCLVSIRMPSDAAGMAGYLRAGDTVDVYDCRESGEIGRASEVREVLTDVCVCSVLNQDLTPVGDAESGQDGEESGKHDPSPAVVVFYVSCEQARILVGLQRDGTLHLALRGGKA